MWRSSSLASAVLLLMATTPAVAQNLCLEQFDSTGNGDDVAVTVAADASNVYIAGTTTDTFDARAPHQGEEDVFIRRTDHTVLGGKTTYTQLGSAAQDYAASVAIGANGGLYVVGRTKGKLSDPKTQKEVYGGPGDNEAWVRAYKFTKKGLFALKWGWNVKTSGSDEMLAVAVDDSAGRDDLFVGGATKGDLQSGADPMNDDEDALVRRYTASKGKLKASNQFGTIGNIDEIFAIAVDATSIYIAGMTRGDVSKLGEPDHQTAEPIGAVYCEHTDCDPPGSGNDGLIARLDRNTLALDWIYQFGHEGRRDAAQDLVLVTDAIGPALYVVGYTGQDDGLYMTDSLCTDDPPLAQEDWTDVFVTRIDLDAAGQPKQLNGPGIVETWRYTGGTCKGDSASAITYGNGRIYVGGATGGELKEIGDNTLNPLEDGFIWEFNLDYGGSSPTMPERMHVITSADTFSDRVNDVVFQGSQLHFVGHTAGVLPGNLSLGGATDAFWGRLAFTCGDGRLDVVSVDTDGDCLPDAMEQCDDGNLDDGDGCSSKCLLEP